MHQMFFFVAMEYVFSFLKWLDYCQAFAHERSYASGLLLYPWQNGRKQWQHVWTFRVKQDKDLLFTLYKWQPAMFQTARINRNLQLLTLLAGVLSSSWWHFCLHLLWW